MKYISSWWTVSCRQYHLVTSHDTHTNAFIGNLSSSNIEIFNVLAKITIRLLLKKKVHSTKIKIPWNRLLVSGLAHKELTNCRSILTSKELGEERWTWKWTILLTSIRELRSQDELMLLNLERETGRYRQQQLTGTETSARTNAYVEKLELQLMDCWRLSVDKFESLKLSGWAGRHSLRETPALLCLTPRSPTRFSERSEKILQCF